VRRVNLQITTEHNLLAIFDRGIQTGSSTSPDNTGQLGPIVFQRKIDMSVSALLNVAKLSLYQDIAKTGFDERLNVCSKLGYGWYVKCKGYLVIHGQKITVLQAKVQPDRGIYSGLCEDSWQ
jgi:hypothetical protein